MGEDLQKVGWVVCENDPVKEFRSLCMQAVEESLDSTWPKALRPGIQEGKDRQTDTLIPSEKLPINTYPIGIPSYILWFSIFVLELHMAE